jgi:hypothetical protein
VSCSHSATRGGLDDPPRPAGVTDTSRTGPRDRHDLAAVPAPPASTLLASDFFHVDCAVALQRISVFFVLEVPRTSNGRS